MLVDARARFTGAPEVPWPQAELILPTGALLLPAIGGLMVISALAVSVMLIAVGYPPGDLSLWAAE
jgi:hypothetical protein